MPHERDDAVIFPETYEWNLRNDIAPRLASPEFAQLAEKELTNKVVLDRFLNSCNRLVEQAREAPTVSVKEHHRLSRTEDLAGLRYARLGNLPRSCERLVREVESEAAFVLHGAVSLEDMICNVAAEWSAKGKARPNYAESSKGVVPEKNQDRRSIVRPKLRADFEKGAPEAPILKWVADRRNDSTHESYLYLSIVQGAGQVVFTSSPTAYEKIDLDDPEVLTADRIARESTAVLKFLSWFIADTERENVALHPDEEE